MAPTPTESTASQPKLPTMSNPNTHTLASSLRHNRNSAGISSKSQVVHVCKDHQHINLPMMASMNSDAWKKSASFSSLATTVGSLIESHSVADVISLVSSKLLIDTGSTFRESSSASKLIVDSILSIGFLDLVTWLTSGGNEVKI